MKKIFNKENCIILIIIFALSLLICFGYVKGHYSIDDYKIMNIGYENYSIQNNLKEGRVVMYLIVQMALLLNINYYFFFIITVVIAIFITCLTMMIFYNQILKNIKHIKKYEKILLLVICYTVFFNFMYIENLYFVESIVMAFSLLFYLLSAKLLVEKKNILLIILFALLANFCYNGMQCYYIILVFLFSLLDEKTNYKRTFINTLIAGFLIIAIVFINYLQIKFICNMFNMQNRRLGDLNYNYFLKNITHIKDNIQSILINTSKLFPKYLYLFFICMCFISSIIYIFVNKNKKYKFKIFVDEILICFISIISCFFIFIFSLSSFGTGRLLYGIGMTIGLMLLLLFLENRKQNNQILKYILIFNISLYFIINAVNYMYIINLHCKVNDLERQELIELEKDICNYEEQNNIKVDKIAIVLIGCDERRAFYDFVKLKNEVTRKGLTCLYSCKGIISFYTNRYLIPIDGNEEILKECQKFTESNDKYILFENILICPIYSW